jgi:2-oxoglutarate dehydrogenase E2 component (dihydrolipoamide succinyltransferase)
MAFSVQMPALGESVTEGTVTRWLKHEGDSVEVDEPLLEVSTDKVDTEIPSPAAGTLQKIVVREDETVEVGAELAVIGDGGGSGGNGASAQPAAPPTEPQQAAAPQPTPPAYAPSAEPPAPAPTSTPSAPASGTPVTMPALGESVTEGTITRWLKQVGDRVEVDEALLEVSTDKVDTEIPSPVAGVLLEISAGEDSTVEVGGQLGVIGSAQSASAQAPAAPAPTPAPASIPQSVWQPPEATQAQPPAPAPTPAPSAPSAAETHPSGGQAEGSNGSAPYVTPLVRKLATENSVDLSVIKGTGVGGRIRKQDVQAAIDAAKRAAAAPTPAPAAASPSAAAPATRVQVSADASGLRGTTQKLTRLRQIVAQRTRESLQVSAQLTQVVEVDVTRIAKLRARAKADFEQREGVKLTFLPFFALATVEALKQHPKLNASIDEEAKQVTYYGAEHLGIAVDTERGLLNAVIHNAGDLNLAGLAHKIADLAARTRANKVTPEELSGGTFSLTNLGSNGALFDTPIIQQPQVGILGVGVVTKRPVVVTDENGDDSIAIRSMAYLALTYDHRLVDGADAGRFLTTIKNRLYEGAFDADLGL